LKFHFFWLHCHSIHRGQVKSIWDGGQAKSVWDKGRAESI